MPQKRHIDLCARLEQAGIIARLFDRLGYKPNQRFNSLHSNERLNFDDPPRFLSVDVYLDTFSMYHRLDLKSLLAEGPSFLPETQLAMIRLQMVEITGADLRDLCALLLEYPLSHVPEKGKIDESQISRLCADDWGWYKTVTMNLDRLTTFAGSVLSGSELNTVVERVRRLRQSIDGAPKNLRWLTRARIGESVRWYATPLTESTRESGRPDLAMG